MLNTVSRILFAILLVAASACRHESTDPEVVVACDASLRSGISVAVVDSLTGAGVLAGATIRAVDGSFRDSLIIAANRADLNSVALGLVWERPGTYVVSVQRLGYQTWTRSNIEVTRGTCHVLPISLTARLQRE
jgi:hypothetical protein